MSYSIGELARLTHCLPQTIRYYESSGLLPPARRTPGNQRRFSESHRQRLAFIRHGRELGFSLEAISELLELADHPDAPCESADRIARAHLVEIESRIARLEALRGEMERVIAECQGEHVAHCRVLEVLGNHELCVTAHGSIEPTGPEGR